MASSDRYNSNHHHHRLSLPPQNPNPNPNPNPNHPPNKPNTTTTTDPHDNKTPPNPLRLRLDSSTDMAQPINNNKHHHLASSSSAMPIDGSDSDSALSRSQLLTRQEVLKRRSRRLKQLAKIYRDHYWSMMEDVKLKFREYCWEYGKSPFLDDDHEDVNRSNNNNNSNNGKLGLGMLGGNGNASRCEMHGCKTKAMALTRFCHSHILSDAKQKLYKGCSYATKSSATGPTLCMKPILRSTVPSLCPLHLEKAEKHVTRALRKAGLNVTSTSKLAPKFHVIVAEYVRQIQSKRRAARKALVDTTESKEGNII